MTGRAGLLIAAATIAACTGPATPTRRTPVIRVTAPAPDETRVTLAGENRPVVGASRAAALHLDLDRVAPASGTARYTLSFPPDFPRRGWRTIEASVQGDADAWVQTATVVLDPDAPLPEAIDVPFGDLAPGTSTRVRILGRAMPAVDTHTVTTAPEALAPGTRLRVGYAVEEPAWHFDSAPVAFVIEAVSSDGVPEELHRRVLDPGHEPADRQWFELDLDLAAFADRDVRVRLRTEAMRSGPALAVWADPRLVAPAPTGRSPNLVLVSLDTVRAASTTPYDAALETTPALAQLLAARGTTAREAIAPFPHTLPSHMSLFTGLYHRTHRVRGFLDRLSDDHPTLPEALRRADRVSAAFTENGFLVGGSGFWRGFSRYVENKSADLHKPDGQARATVDAGIAWLRAHHDEPFFLFLHTYEAHWPYAPGPEHADLFVDDAPPPFGIARALLRYHQEIRSADDQLRRVLDTLDELGLSDDTLVVVTSDHGEEFGEHGQRFHGHQLHTEALRVPLVFRWPGVVAADATLRFPVSLVDVTPTVLDLLGLPPLANATGRSLAPWLRAPDTPAPGTVVFAEAPASLESAHVDLAGVQTATRKCIRRPDAELATCFDLTTDPGERAPLADLTDLATRAALDHLTRFTAGGPTETTPGDRRVLDPAMERKLEALGYLEPGAD